MSSKYQCFHFQVDLMTRSKLKLLSIIIMHTLMWSGLLTQKKLYFGVAREMESLLEMHVEATSS